MVMKMKKTRLFFGILLSLLLLVGCSTINDEKRESEKHSQNEKENNILNISLGTDMLTWDIHNHTTSSTESVHINVFDYLIMRDWSKDGEFIPHLATSWEQKDDTTWNFKLRDDVTFHNGDKLTANDVKYTLERVAKDTSLKSNGDYNTIEQVEVVNDYEFNIHTKEPDPILESRLSRQASGILPKQYMEKNGLEEFLKNPVGSGPLKFKSWNKGSEVVLEPNEDYWGEKVTKWKEVHYKAITENSTRVSELITGGLDIAANVPPSDWDRITSSDEVSLQSGESNRTYLLFLDMADGKPASDINVRKAIDYAIDDQALVDILKGGGTPSLTRVNPGNVGFNESLYDKYNFDVEKAKEYLKKAGYESGELKLKLTGPQGRYLQDTTVLQMIGGMLENVGIEMELNLLEFSVFSEVREKKQFGDGYLIALGSSFFDAAQSLAYYSPEMSSTTFGYNNKKVTELLKEAETSMDEEIRVKNYKEVQEIVAEDIPIVVLFQMDQFYGTNKDLELLIRLDEVIYIPELQKMNE